MNERTCPECGTTFTPRTNQRYCNQGLAALERHGPSWALKALTYLGDPPVAVMRRKAS